MRILILLLLSLLSLKCSSQCTAKLDTIPVKIIVPDQPRKYNYYNKDGSLAWGAVKEYDESLIPLGGRWTVYIPGNKATIKDGFRVYQTLVNCKMETIGYLDTNKKPIVISKPEFDIAIFL